MTINWNVFVCGINYLGQIFIMSTYKQEKESK